jgi:hypothetical protein
LRVQARFFFYLDTESPIKICTHYKLTLSDLISLYFIVQQFFDQKNLFIQADYNCLKVLKLDICLGLLKRPFTWQSKVPDRFIALKKQHSIYDKQTRRSPAPDLARDAS